MAGSILPRDTGGKGADPVICWVYDPVTLALARMTQPILEAGSVSVNGTVTLGANSGVDIGDVTLTAGTNAIGKLVANDGVDIGDVTLNNSHISVQQDVVADANNSSTTNLATPAFAFTGTATSTLGVAGIQIGLFADKNCKVLVEQSPNNTPNWDLIDTFYYTANATNFGITVQAIGAYVRVVVSTNAETTTVFRLSTVLCPIVEALPRALDANGNFKISAPTDNYGWKAEHTSMGEIRVAEPYRLVGSAFEGATIDSRFWTTAAAGDAAAVAQANAQLLITSGTSSGATVTAFTVRRARYVGGNSMRYRSVTQVEAGTANNVRRWGIGWGSTAMPTVTDGAWFQLNGTSFQVVMMKGGSANTISSFNGNLGATYDPGTSVKTYEIYWTNSKVWFVIGDEILHTHSASTATWANTMTFHGFMDSVNSDVALSKTLATRTSTIYRLGRAETQPQYYNITGNAATHTVKLGPGFLHRLIFNNTTGTSFIIYDQTSAAVPIIGTVTTSSAALGSWHYGLPFFNGLVIVTTGNGLDMTVVYE